MIITIIHEASLCSMKIDRHVGAGTQTHVNGKKYEKYIVSGLISVN